LTFVDRWPTKIKQHRIRFRRREESLAPLLEMEALGGASSMGRVAVTVGRATFQSSLIEVRPRCAGAIRRDRPTAGRASLAEAPASGVKTAKRKPRHAFDR